MKKAPKGKTGRGRRIRRWILVLLALLLVFAAVTLAWDPFRLIVREGTAAHKAEIMEFVESHSQEILENIRKKHYAKRCSMPSFTVTTVSAEASSLT